MIRSYIPKGASIDAYSRQFIEEIVEKMNQLLRKILGYLTPQTAFEQALKQALKQTLSWFDNEPLAPWLSSGKAGNTSLYESDYHGATHYQIDTDM